MIIETKLHVPQTNGYLINRSHLFQQLEKGLNAKLTLIHAPAGYGKSTLLSEWVKTIDLNSAWVSLDVNDNDPVRFWKHTIKSLDRISSRLVEQLVLPQAITGTASIAELINQLNRLSERIVLIWDDFHYVNNELLLNHIAYFLEHLPPSIHICMASRTRPLLPLSRMRVEGSLNEIDVNELRFSQEEMKHFFTQHSDLFFSKEELTTIYAKTEGWIAGMRMLALAMDDVENTNPKTLIYKITGEHRNFTDYFLEEIFMKQTIEMQQFLLKTSILDRIHVELVDILMHNGAERMQQLERDNLFLISLDDTRTWYRYHHLYQDFLQTKLREIMPNELEALYRIAGRWFADNEFYHEAMDHYLAGKQYTEALQLFEQIAPAMIHSELGVLRQWFQMIPDAMLIEKPKLLMYDIFSLFMMGEMDTAKMKLTHSFTEKTAHSFQSDFKMLKVIGAIFEQDFESFIRLSEAYVEMYPEEESFISLGTEGDLDIPNWSFLETVENLKERERIMIRLLTCWGKSKHYYFVADLSIGYGELLYEWNRLEEAEHFLQQAKQLGEAHHNKVITVLADLNLAKIYAASGKEERAEEIFSELSAEVDSQSYPKLYRYIQAYQAYILILRGKGDQALGWLDHCNFQITDEISQTMLLEYGVFADLLREQGKKEKAMTVTLRLIREARRAGRKGDCIHFLIKHSILLAEIGEMVRGLDVLEEALFLAEPDEYRRTFIDAGKPLMELLQTYLETRQKQHRQQIYTVTLSYVNELLHFKNIQYGQKINSVRRSIGDVYLTEKESLVLQLLQTSLTNKEIAGNLGVSLSTVKTHINNIYTKIKVNNRMEAIERGKQLDILP